MIAESPKTKMVAPHGSKELPETVKIRTLETVWLGADLQYVQPGWEGDVPTSVAAQLAKPIQCHSKGSGLGYTDGDRHVKRRIEVLTPGVKLS